MSSEPTNDSTVEYNSELAISSVQDLVAINPEGFTRVTVGDYELYVENGPKIQDRKDPNIANTFENQRFFGIEHTEPKFPGQQGLEETKSSIFSISSHDSWNPIWDLELTTEGYAKALINATNTLKRDIPKGSREIITTLPKGEVLEISFIPLDLNGQKNGHGVALREILEQRKAVLQKRN